MHKVVLDETKRAEMRRKTAAEPWARAIVERLRASIARDPLRPETPYEALQPYTHAQPCARQARDMALVHAATGDEGPLEPMVAHFRQRLRLEEMERALDDAPPPELDRINARHVKNWRPEHWSYGLMNGGLFYAYDLTRGHPIWQRDGLGERVEKRLHEILAAQKPALARARGWANTNTFHAATGAVLGAMLDDAEALDLAIEGPIGFKAILGLLVDGGLWPEPVNYGLHYVNGILTMIAEVARHAGRAELHRWETDEGVSLKSTYDRFLALLFAHGRLAGHGDGGGTSEHARVRAAERFTTWNHPVDRLWGHAHNRNANTFEIAYRLYNDPRYAWLLAQQPARDTWDHELFGFCALTHGVPLGETEPPDAASRVFRAYGAALVRGDESAGYWHGTAPAAYVRSGAPQAHGHSDAANLLLNAHGRNLYPDVQYKWNYQSRVDPDTGENLNPTPYSRMRFAHNTVSLDFADAPADTAQIGAVRRSGPLRAVTVYDGAAPLRRTVGVTPEYVLDWACAGHPAAGGGAGRNIDYHLHGLGLPELDDLPEPAAYTTLGAEYGLGPIDTRSEAPSNQWVRPGVSAVTDGDWSAVMREERPLEPDAPRGVRLHVLGAPATRVITGDVPDYVSMDGWDASQPETGEAGRFGLLVVRRVAPETEFLVIHQPFRGAPPAPLAVERRGDTVTVRGPGFRDTIALPTLACHRRR